MLKRLKPFFGLTFFVLGAPLAWPLAAFWSASTTRPLPSTAIVYSMQRSELRRDDSLKCDGETGMDF